MDFLFWNEIRSSCIDWLIGIAHSRLRNGELWRTQDRLQTFEHKLVLIIYSSVKVHTQSAFDREIEVDTCVFIVVNQLSRHTYDVHRSVELFLATARATNRANNIVSRMRSKHYVCRPKNKLYKLRLSFQRMPMPLFKRCQMKCYFDTTMVTTTTHHSFTHAQPTHRPSEIGVLARCAVVSCDSVTLSVYAHIFIVVISLGARTRVLMRATHTIHTSQIAHR